MAADEMAMVDVKRTMDRHVGEGSMAMTSTCDQRGLPKIAAIHLCMAIPITQ